MSVKLSQKLKRAMNLTLEKDYLRNRWVGDHVLLSILHKDYNLEKVNKSYFNRYLPELSLDNGMFIHCHVENRLKRKDKGDYSRKAHFYFFTEERDFLPETNYTRKQWADCYFNFCPVGTSKQMNTTTTATNTDDAASTLDSSTTTTKVNPMNPTIATIIGNSFTSTTNKKLFGCKTGETIHSCLQRRIQLFDNIINNKQHISSIIHRANEKDCKLTETQVITMTQRILFLRQSYQNVMETDINTPLNYESCCHEAINTLRNLGLSMLSNPRVVMQWNRTFRVEEKFPHPNSHIK